MFKPCRLASILLGVTAVGLLVNAQADRNPVTGEWEGDVAAQTFAEYCRGELPADRMTTFFSELDKAERAVAAGKTDGTVTALNGAWEAAYRGDAYNDNGVRCLGEQATRRWIKANLALWRLGAGSGPDGVGGNFTGMYVAAADGGTDGIIADVSALPARGFRNSLTGLEGIVSVTDGRRSFGALVLPEEDAVANACRAAIGQLHQMAVRRHRESLAAEERAFNRPPTEQELAATESVSDAGAFASAIAGIEIDTMATKESMLMQRQVDESQNLLREARAWDLERSGDIKSRPTSQRAGARGDILLARADDTQLGLRARDMLYRDAEQYFEFGGFSDKEAAASTAREAIQSALQAERNRQNQAVEKAAAEFEGKGEAVQKAVDDMQKTEAEQQSFKDEADALEAELGF